MIELTFLNNYAPVWLLVVLVAIIYAGLKQIKLPGNDFVLALISVVISFMLVASQNIINFLIGSIPYMTLILTLAFFTTLILAFVGKSLDSFKTPLFWIGFALIVIIFLASAFHNFPTLNNILPNSGDSDLSPAASQLKSFIYSQNFKDSIVFIGSLALVCIFLLKKASK